MDTKTIDPKTARIRELNDDLRRRFVGGSVLMTTGVAALGAEVVNRIATAISVFDDFCRANDPHSEHDAGHLDTDGVRLMWKIDYYNKTFDAHSPDPSDSSVTERVITIMLAEEY